jgi:flavin-dependent dehydrogenase
MTDTYDCIVIGGGPSGSTVATLLAQYGHRVILLERTQFPRFHIGESLMPETYWVFKRLNMLDTMKNSHFVKKYSVQFTNPAGRDSQPFYFDQDKPHESSQTWQIVRSEFDKMMLDNAEKHGVEVWSNANVTDILLEPGDSELPRATGVVVSREGGAPQTLHAKVVIDATGTNALLSRKLNIRKKDPMLRKMAVFSHYKGARRDQGKNEGATLVLATPNQDGWFWYIPLPDDIVSVGVVAEPEALLSGGTPEEILDAQIKGCRGLDDRMSNAVRVAEVRVLSDFSYRSTHCAGDGWVLVGDAFGFLDPIYSSGVFLAMKSGQLAADAVHEALAKNDLSGEALGKWGTELSDGMHAIRKIVYAYYTKGFSFGRFIRAFPHRTRNITDLLVGDVFRPEVQEVFKDLETMVPLPEQIPLSKNSPHKAMQTA